MTSNSIDPYYIWTGKVAVALALIRNTPDGLTAKEYAEQMCSSFMRSQLYHKQRLERLSTALLLSPQPECTDVGDGSEGDIEPPLLTPPFSSEDPRRCSNQSAIYKEAGLHDQVKLLQGILSLRSLPPSTTLTDWEMNDLCLVNIGRAFDTLTQALTGEGPTTLPKSMFCDAVEVICRLVKGNFSASVTGVVMHKTQDLLHTIVISIINQDGINQLEIQEKRSKVLLQLGRCSRLRGGILTLLARCLAHFGSGLRQVLSKDVPCQPHVCENIFFIFECMEKLLMDLAPSGDTQEASSGSGTKKITMTNELKTSTDSEMTKEESRKSLIGQCPPLKGKAKHDISDLNLKPQGATNRVDLNISLPKEVLDTINIQLEDSLVLISQRFPCYAYAVWHLKGLLEQVQMQ